MVDESASKMCLTFMWPSFHETKCVQCNAQSTGADSANHCLPKLSADIYIPPMWDSLIMCVEFLTIDC